MTDKKTLVIYHARCADGFTAAWVAWKKFGDEAEYLPAAYGDPVPNVEGREVYILDFSYDPHQLEWIAEHALSLTMLDHHLKSLERVLDYIDKKSESSRKTPIPHGPFTWFLGEGYRVYFDLEQSGARIAWQHFFPDEPAPELVRYVEDRDLWAWRLEWSREVNAFIQAIAEPTFIRWEQLYMQLEERRGLDQLSLKGATILMYQEKIKTDAIANAMYVRFGGYDVPIVNTAALMSEIGNQLAKCAPFAVLWCQQSDGRFVVSLRSVEGGANVADIAAVYGGGGHKHAAGFKCRCLPWTLIGGDGQPAIWSSELNDAD